MYSLKQLTTDQDLDLFRHGYAGSFSERAKIARRELTLPELRASSFVYGLFKGKKLVAGFILNYFPGRCLEEFSEPEKTAIVEGLGADKVCELVGIWKDKKERSAATTLTMWSFIIKRTLGLKRAYIFGCNRSEKVGKEYYYQANFTLVPNPHSELMVFYYTRRQFLMTFFNSLFKFLNKKGLGPKKKIFTKVREATV